jgi:hypothetical protein
MRPKRRARRFTPQPDGVLIQSREEIERAELVQIERLRGIRNDIRHFLFLSRPPPAIPPKQRRRAKTLTVANSVATH